MNKAGLNFLREIGQTEQATQDNAILLMFKSSEFKHKVQIRFHILAEKVVNANTNNYICRNSK